MIISSIGITLTVTAIVLASLNIIKERWHTVAIYIVGLLAVYSTTLVGLSVVGSDIPRELVMSKIAMRDGWDLNLLDISNTSFVVGWLVPRLSVWLWLEPEWVYKVVLPMVFACTPVLLYLIFRKQFGGLRAFYASVFFVMVPIYSLEIPTIGKSMVAEALMALCLWAMFTDWRAWQKCVAMTVLALLTMWAHYTVGIILVGFLSLILIIVAVAKLFRNWKLWARRMMPIWAVAVVIVVTLPAFYVYYSNVGQAQVTTVVTRIGQYYVKNVMLGQPVGKAAESANMTTPEAMYAATPEDLHKIIYTYKPHEATKLEPTPGVNPDRIVQAGLGLDFRNATPLGMAFRIVQYLTQLLIVLGCFQLLFRYKRYNVSAEFVAGIGACLLILACCIAVPNFSTLINMTRWYHASLFFLAPMFVLGFELIWVRKQSGQ